MPRLVEAIALGNTFAMIRAYEEIVDFIAASNRPEVVMSFEPSDETKERVADLIAREKRGELLDEEAEELDCYMKAEHIMRLAKAKARKRLP
jgi:hypothetical protein